MNDHIPDPTKMISDTPRTDARRGFHGWYTAVDAEFSEKLERELNVAQQRINRLEEENNELRAEEARLLNTNGELERRIKRLEEDSQRLNWLLNRGLAWRGCYNDCWIEGTWLYASQSALETIDKAKEDKLRVSKNEY